ncbi:hypothetical protein MSG28_000785 [Choristoneura fumiferana]|uniref:Uncharacterized protein n=1 Tax=Choristoneura fumiferana TaxID=7141 RepID=A0ACC0K2Y3_CHOFU|nr:hypothetical protein MSG28_000785 [Choristoneura fumiferana]
MVGKPAHVLNNNLNHNTYNTLEWIHHVLIPTLRYMKETMSPLTLTIRLIVKPDFDEENRIINRCSGMIVDGQIATGSHYSGNLSSASSSLASSSETISSFSNMIANDYSLPGCSKSEHCDDSNTTIKNMIHSRKPVYTVEDASRKEVYKPDFMQKLLNSGIQEKKDFPKGKLYKGDQMGESSCENHTPDVCELDAMGGPSGRTSSNASSIGSTSSDSTKEFTVPSTSNAEKLLGLDDSQKNEPGSSKSATYMQPFCDGDDDSDEDVIEETWCTCLFQAWSNAEKIQAIDALIGRCAASHVRHMMKAIEPLFQRDFISLLPKELALTVLGYLQPKDLLRAAQTCRYWRFLADDNLLWKEQCRRIGITTLKKMPRSLPRCVSPWKAAYMRQYLIENNWLHKPVNNPIMMRGHDDHVITCLQFYGNRILSGSDDTTLKVWSAITGKCLRTLVGHSGGVWSSQMVGDLVISGSTDRTLRVWNAKTGHCQKVLAGHTSTVRCMHLYNNRVVSGSRDATLRVWSIPEGRCLRVLVGHLAAVRCVQYDGKVVVSGAYDYFVKVWNPDTGECLHTLAGHTNRPNKHQSAVTCLQSSNRFVITSSDDGTVKLWDVRTGEFIRNLVELSSGGSGGVVWRIRASATKLICAVGSRNGTEETKLLVLDFDVPGACRKCDE